ncbi:uncharacterized protein CHSO_3235 [Chryseobacterium sp. StRB126]|nr:uncharacterized protein CHSO_3235 [Chryseobacterium sp. StRB126]
MKYDGLNFTTFNEFPISNLFFGNFLGKIEDDNIIVYNNFEKEKILIRGRVPKVLNTKDNMYKVFSKKKGVYLKKIIKNDLVSSYEKSIQYSIQLKSGMYIFTNNSINYTEKNKSVRIIIPFSNQALHNVFVKGSTLYITDPMNRKIYALNRGVTNIYSGSILLNDPTTKIYWHQTTDQTFFINQNNIYILENNVIKPRFLVKYNDLGNYPISSLYYDKKVNKLYIGTVNNGLNIVDLNQFYIAKDDTPFANNVFYATIPFSKNTVITANGLEFSKEGISKRYLFSKQGKYCLLYDDKKNIVFTNKGYIIRFRSKDYYQKSDSLYIRDLDQVFKSNSLYSYSTTDFINNNYLYIFKNDQFKKPDYCYKFKGVINSFINDGQNILVGCTNGLYQISLKNNKQKIFPGIYVKNIISTKDGNIWVTSNKNGFFLFRNNKLIKMPNDPHNFLSSAHYILEDKHGYFWISSNNGLFKVKKRQLLQYAYKKTPVFYYRFSKRDGFLTNEFNNSAAHILDNGEFAFPSMNGFVFFDPNTIKSYYPQNIYIDKAKINDSTVKYFKDTLTLKSDYKLAELLIEAPYYSGLDNLYIETKIRNSKQNWERLKDNRFLIKGLFPGEYELQFRVLVSPEGKFLYKKINIIIEAHFYQTLLFKILLAIVFILLIIWVIKMRTNLLKSKNKSLEKLVVEKENVLKKTSEDLVVIREILKNETEYQKKIIETISHDIATPIKYLSYLSKNLHELEDIQSQKKYLDSIYKSSKEVYKFTLNLKEYSSLYRDDKIYEENEYPISEIIEVKRNLFQELSLLNNTVIYNKVNQDTMTSINKNIILAIIHNLLDNSLKNTKSGMIIIESNIGQGYTEIKISDTGIGMSDEQIDYYMNLSRNFRSDDLFLKKYGLGLHMVIHFIKKIDARISFSKNQPKGTITSIIIKNR